MHLLRLARSQTRADDRPRRLFQLLFVGIFAAAIPGCTYLSQLFDSDEVESSQHGRIPDRPFNRPTGSQFAAKIGNLDIATREEAILREAIAGNIPQFLRDIKAVDVSSSVGGRFIKATIYVMPDYLAIGSDEDHVRVPMNPITAQKIADQYGYLLPTTRIVDAVYKAATAKLDPRPLPPGSKMTGVPYLVRHDKTIQAQLGRRLGQLTAGHKKDVVLTNRLVNSPTKVAIYGWHRKNGRPIQPLSLVHGIKYVDYSHGVRLVSNTMTVDGKSMPTSRVLRDPLLAPLISSEGALSSVKIRGSSLSATAETEMEEERL